MSFSSNALLCILFEGVISAKEAAHPTDIAFSVCVSLKEEQIIDPTTLFEMGPEFFNTFREQLPIQNHNDRFDDAQWETVVSYINSYSNDELTQMICANPQETLAIQAEGIVVLFPVPRTIGDYVKIFVPYTWNA